MKKKYVVAGCRPWNESSIIDLKKVIDGEIVGVSTPDELNEILNRESKIEYIFFLHWSSIVPKTITEQYECVCFHMTDVPFGRGGSPLQNLIVRGLRVTKLTALRMSQEVDAGPVYLKRDLSLEGSSAEEIYVRAGNLSVQMIREIIEKKIQPEEQVGEVVLFKRRKPSESLLPSEASLLEVHDFIRMLDAEGYPHAFVEIGGLRLEFKRSSLYGDCVKAEVEISIAKHIQ